MSFATRKQVFSGETVQNADLFSADLDVTNFSIGSAQVVYTGTSLAGSAKLQWSNDGANWFDVASSSQNLVATGGALGWEKIEIGFSRLRMVVTSTDADTVTIVSGVILAKMPGG